MRLPLPHVDREYLFDSFTISQANTVWICWLVVLLTNLKAPSCTYILNSCKDLFPVLSKHLSEWLLKYVHYPLIMGLPIIILVICEFFSNVGCVLQQWIRLLFFIFGLTSKTGVKKEQWYCYFVASSTQLGYSNHCKLTSAESYFSLPFTHNCL